MKSLKNKKAGLKPAFDHIIKNTIMKQHTSLNGHQQPLSQRY